MTISSTSKNRRASDDERVAAGLIAYYHLADEAVSKVRETMLAKQLSFADAAVASGVVTQNERNQASAWVEHSERDESFIETAMRKRTVNRLPVRHVESVKPGPEIMFLQDPHCARSERVRGLRTELLMFDAKSGEANTLAVLSPTAREGRSLLTAELAIAFAQLGRRTLLIDADMRNPSLHVLFGSDHPAGLAQALSLGEPARLLGVEGVPQLSLVTAGSRPSQPLELLSGGEFDRMLSDWRRSFEFILIDTPPVSEYTDGLVVATSARQVLVVSRAAVTAHRNLKKMLRSLTATRASVIGAVLNHF